MEEERRKWESQWKLLGWTKYRLSEKKGMCTSLTLNTKFNPFVNVEFNLYTILKFKLIPIRYERLRVCVCALTWIYHTSANFVPQCSLKQRMCNKKLTKFGKSNQRARTWIGSLQQFNVSNQFVFVLKMLVRSRLLFTCINIHYKRIHFDTVCVHMYHTHTQSNLMQNRWQ